MSEAVGEMSEAVGGMPPNSPATSLSSLSSPSRSPSPETFNSVSDSDKRFLMPYYQLPDPDLDEFLAEKEKIMSFGKKKFPLPLSVPEDNKKNRDLDNFIRKIFPKTSHQLEPIDLKCNKEVTKSSISIEYSKVVSRIQKIDDSKSPGIKRFALKELLKKQIKEKKFAAFNKSKEISNLDEYEEVESDMNENEQLDTKAIESESDKETSDEDIEEETVSFSFVPEKSNLEADESDEDISIIKKSPRKLEISDDEDDNAELPDITTDFVHHIEDNSIQNNVVNFEEENNSISSYQQFDGDLLPGIEVPGSPDSLASEKCKSFDTDFLNFEKNKLSVVPSLPMDDPPIFLTKNGSEVDNLFLSQDLAVVCSGSFNNKEDNKLTSLSYEDNLNSDVCEDSPFEEKMNDFFDLEAELSGEDDGEDDPDSDIEGVDDLIASDHELPSNAELKDEIADLHLKQFIDDDEEILKEYKEAFLESGELHNDGRTRRFAWKKAIDIDDTGNNYALSSSESEDDDVSDSSSVKAEKAKLLKETEKEEITGCFNSSSKPLLKRQILGKPKTVNIEESSSTRKRPRGSFLNLDDATKARVMKRLKKIPEECIINNIRRQSVKEKAAAGNPGVPCNMSNFENYFTKM